MKPAVILLVEDNPITRKVVRFTLESQGLIVVAAPDAETALDVFSKGPVALVLQDLCLPDMDGFDLVARLRALPGGADIPILVFSGMLSHHDEARVFAAGFDDLISKPVEPSRLVQIVRSHLPSESPGGDLFGKGRRLVVADDDPVQRKLASFRMQKMGFEVFTAADGHEALAHARQIVPDAVLSDVLMPGLDGFGLCMAMRRDPTVAHVPIVLATNSYVEATDRDLARRAGAHDLVLRTPELREVLAALRRSMESVPLPMQPGDSSVEVGAEHMRRMMRQLERQVALNARVNQRCTLLSAEMSVLRGISEALASHEDIDAALRHTLAACFDAGGVSLGVLYVKDHEGLRVVSFGFSESWSEAELLSFFGERETLDALIGSQSTVILTPTSGQEARRVLEKASALSGLLTPLVYKSMSFGALLMLSRSSDLESRDRVEFAEAVAGQISQALAVAHAFRQTERSERIAREQESLLRSILESIGDAVVVADEHGNLTHWNPAAHALVELGPRTPGFQTVSETAGIYESDKSTPMKFEALPLVRAIRGESVDGAELFVRHPGESEGRWLGASARPWRDDTGATLGGVAVFRDITHEKATQSQLMVSDRMASVGMLAAGVAHEINNPLACVLANLELSQRALATRTQSGDLGELREMLDDARDAATRVRQIVRDLKIFSHPQDVRSKALDVHRVLESSLRMAWNEIRHRARLVKDYGPVAFVEGSESRLGQVFLNLIVNAAQSIPEGDAEGNTIRIRTHLDATGRVVVSVSDTGAGIPAENLQHLFRPFFTTKGPGVGTGLGLAICHRIVTGFGGDIRVESEVGKGTTFKVTLSPAHSVEPAAQQSPQPETRATRRARILVIDDEPLIAMVIQRMLSPEHDVVTTTAGSEAVDRVRRGEHFDVVLCDLMMPQMSGMDVYAALQSLGPEYAARVVFLTGGAFTQAARSFLDVVPNQRVEKPFDVQQLRAVVNDRIR